MSRTLASAMARLDQLAKFEQGWFVDGYKDDPEPEGEAINPQLIDSVRGLLRDMEAAGLPLPCIFPLLDGGGGLYFEWMRGGVPDAVRQYLSTHPVANEIMLPKDLPCLISGEKMYSVDFPNRNVVQ